ncbi:hypothetical protein Z946_3843 [Sulfitobacter noctilucicola]|uniref:Uncharacterized protein n=1 Tax=Sulfitobacter noctilucicola TaxID=1342301 RepID=A0A7W6M7S4_9RHOB|nr:hypothetical protein [Sulfitobacter noctilucicola]KIN64947.1 hypothetical protein Z946_3843 [Sulfitobacter noctilucicola]MBB4173911.1 hypothetical protein [Sulfitobacter noctilucicola]
MPSPLRAALVFSVLGVAACDELAVANDPVALAELRGQKSCISAVTSQTGAEKVVINTTIPVIETNRFIVDVPGAKPWTCVTDDKGVAIEIVERRNG